MPGYLLHQGATVMCAHGGSAQPAQVNPRVTVGGQPTLVQSTTHTIAGCPYVTGNVPTPCVTGQWTLGASRIASAGQALLLRDSQAICAPNGTPVNVVVTQVRVKGI